MILIVKSDAAYLVASKSRSMAADYFYLCNKYGKHSNRPIFIQEKLIKTVLSSAKEAYCGGLYMNAQEPVPTKKNLLSLETYNPHTETQLEQTTEKKE